MSTHILLFIRIFICLIFDFHIFIYKDEIFQYKKIKPSITLSKAKALAKAFLGTPVVTLGHFLVRQVFYATTS